MTARRYATKGGAALNISVYEEPDGKFQQFLIE